MMDREGAGEAVGHWIMDIGYWTLDKRMQNKFL